MSTIEQAAKRLALLRRSGTQVGLAATETPQADGISDDVENGEDPARPPKARQESSLRAFRDGQASEQDGPSMPLGGETLPSPPSELFVDIDLARLSANGYVTPLAPRSAVAEQFRVIKRPLLNNARGRSAAPVANGNRIMVTSSVPSEGKTFVAVNLAMSLAMELDTQVLLVDADTSRPAVLERLGLDNGKGLLDLLVDPALPLESVLMSTNVERLFILPAGKAQAQATELLASEAMSRLVERLAADPRLVVLFDTPPLLAASEAPVLAAHMGQVILVVAADDTPQSKVAEALATVENCPLVMTLLNRSSAFDGKGYYGSYGAYAQ